MGGHSCNGGWIPRFNRAVSDKGGKASPLNAPEAPLGVKSGKAHMEHGSAPKADMSEPCRHFRVVPSPDSMHRSKTTSLFDHLVSAISVGGTSRPSSSL